MKVSSIEKKIRNRVSSYNDTQYSNWLYNWAIPLIQNVKIEKISWEDIIKKIKQVNSNQGKELQKFYELCLKFN